jgi:hypothetical protein
MLRPIPSVSLDQSGTGKTSFFENVVNSVFGFLFKIGFPEGSLKDVHVDDQSGIYVLSPNGDADAAQQLLDLHM